VHYFIGEDLNVYEFRGVEPVAIGDAIVRDLQERADSTAAAHFVVRVNTSTSEVYVGIISIDRTALDFIYVYNWDEKSWSTWEDLVFRAFDVVERPTSRTWNQMVGTWDEQVAIWDSRASLAQSPFVTIGGSTQAYELNTNRSSDISAVTYGGSGSSDVGIDFDWQSKDDDYGLPGKEKTVVRVGVLYRNFGRQFSLNIELSTNEGNSWTSDTLTLGSTSNPDEVKWGWSDPIVTGNSLRVRLRNNSVGENVEVHQIIIEGEESGASF